MTTIWLTRIIPNPHNRQASRDFRNSVELHYRVMKLFPHNLGDQARRQLGILFRAEETPQGPYLLLQSLTQPDLNLLPPGYGTADTRPLNPLLDALRPGLPVRYRIDANAVRKPRKTTQELYNLKPVTALTGPAAVEWWQRQAEQSGLKVGTVHATRLAAASGLKAQGKQRIHNTRTRFEGDALISDPELLRRRIAEGIGRGKAYGCGLLSLAPATAR
ncbi:MULTISPECIES: type I-E CRISPR-associated protein Cas6/Cse3/CasE [unclassified Streptomyces]|uniref:type I-E CRISPR-associated protein Cas6/Cse3/CasE n=1 Tax=unclassified Streptomyces TaxID=2593676 RepID=UPI00099DC41F|nr:MULTISPECIES: type I-E CRISPR-associated protein Cas6/Cse3/CasE [unclassified Streptomyces]